MLKKLLVILVGVVLLGGCTVQNNVATVEQGVQEYQDIQQAKQNAHEVMAMAHEEFFRDVPSMGDVHPTVVGKELSVEAWGVKEFIIAYAFEAYNTGDTSKLVNYLKEQNLYERYQAISRKYDLDKQEQILTAKPVTGNLGMQSVTESFFDNYLTGDFFLCYGDKSTDSSLGKSFGMLIPGIWKHAGIMDTQAPDRNAPVLSASNATTSGFCVGDETENKWANEASVSAYRVNGRTDSKARNGVDYAKQFVGQPYNILASRSSDTGWYCSKVVYRAWLSQGINIEPTPWITDPWVTPTDLADDSDTYWIGGDQS